MGCKKRGNELCWAELGADGDSTERVACDRFVKIIIMFSQHTLVVLGSFIGPFKPEQRWFALGAVRL